MKKIFFSLNILLIIVLSACGNVPAPAAPIPLTPHPSAPPDDALYQTSCVTIYPSVPEDVKLPGFAVLVDHKANSHLFLKNLQNGSETPLATPNDTVSDIRISPDHTTIGYQLGNPKTLEWRVIVADSQGQRKSETVWPKGFFILGKWVNNESILLLTDPPFVVYNPATQQEVSFNFDDFPAYAYSSNNNRIIEFDRNLEKAAYKNTNDKVSIYDIATKKVIAEVDNHPNPSLMAEWAPDGSKVAVNGTIMLTTNEDDRSEDIFLVTRDGQVTRTSRLTDHFGKQFSISKAGLSWSPDSRYLGFWAIYRQNGYENWELVVHDTVTQKTTNYCVLNQYEHQWNATHYLLPPVWSPDGKYLLVENRYNNSESRTLILNLATLAAYQIEENKFPAGWVAAP